MLRSSPRKSNWRCLMQQRNESPQLLKTEGKEMLSNPTTSVRSSTHIYWNVSWHQLRFLRSLWRGIGNVRVIMLPNRMCFCGFQKKEVHVSWECEWQQIICSKSTISSHRAQRTSVSLIMRDCGVKAPSTNHMWVVVLKVFNWWLDKRGISSSMMWAWSSKVTRNELKMVQQILCDNSQFCMWWGDLENSMEDAMEVWFR